MIDLSSRKIKHLFEERMMQLTRQTIAQQDQIFDYQLSGGWAQ